MKKTVAIGATLTTILFAGCAASGEDEKTIKLGVSGSDTQVWDYVAKKAEKEGIKIELVKFSDYVQPNMALAEG
ncbi:MAG: MetQ/NlpA family ABC transporter substrate-binding protein, partial [Exiguobacterium acetylicum]